MTNEEREVISKKTEDRSEKSREKSCTIFGQYGFEYISELTYHISLAVLAMLLMLYLWFV